jgi:hypothetical protein
MPLVKFFSLVFKLNVVTSRVMLPVTPLLARAVMVTGLVPAVTPVTRPLEEFTGGFVVVVGGRVVVVVAQEERPSTWTSTSPSCGSIRTFKN